MRPLSKENCKVSLSDGIEISFIHGEKKTGTLFPYKSSTTETGFVYCENKTKHFSIEQVSSYALALQVLARFSTDIAVPFGRIKLCADEECDCVYHADFGIKGILNEPNVNAYRLFPVPCDKILKTRGALERWFDNWKNNAGALILYAEGQNKPINRVKAVNAKASEIPKSFSLDDN